MSAIWLSPQIKNAREGERSNRAVKCEKKGLTLPSVEVDVLLHSFCLVGLNVVVGVQETFLS